MRSCRPGIGHQERALKTNLAKAAKIIAPKSGETQMGYPPLFFSTDFLQIISFPAKDAHADNRVSRIAVRLNAQRPSASGQSRRRFGIGYGIRIWELTTTGFRRSRLLCPIGYSLCSVCGVGAKYPLRVCTLRSLPQFTLILRKVPSSLASLGV